MIEKLSHDIGLSKHVGFSYADAIEIPANARLLISSGTPGISSDGTIPKGIAEQSEQVWRNVLEVLEKAHMTTANLVKVTTTLTRTEDIPAYTAIRKRVLADVRPTFMLQVVTQMVRPEFLVEVEIIAAAKG